MLIAFQRKVRRLDQLQPLRLINTRPGKLGHAVGDHQFWHRVRLAGHLLVEHVQVVLVHMGIADEVGEPARRVAGQAADEAEQRGAFGQVERRADSIPAMAFLHFMPE